MLVGPKILQKVIFLIFFKWQSGLPVWPHLSEVLEDFIRKSPALLSMEKISRLALESLEIDEGPS